METQVSSLVIESHTEMGSNYNMLSALQEAQFEMGDIFPEQDYLSRMYFIPSNPSVH